MITINYKQNLIYKKKIFKGRGPDYSNPNNININDSLGDYLLTLVESLTTLIVIGNSTEFQRATKLVIKNLNFNKNNTVQVFESTIRYQIDLN